MFAAVRELNQYFVDLWWECNTGFPDLDSRYTPDVQARNEKSLLHFLDQVEHMLANPPRSREEAQSVKLRLGAGVRYLAEEVLDLTETQLDLLPTDAFSSVAEEFVRQARAFDSQIEHGGYLSSRKERLDCPWTAVAAGPACGAESFHLCL